MFSPRGGSSNFDTYSTTATAAGTTTLLNTSSYKQFFTGATTQTVLLPVTSTMSLGQQFLIVNDSSGVVTVQSSGANTLQAMAASTEMLITCISLSGTGTASWSWDYGAKGTVPVGLGGTGLTSGTSGGVPYFSATSTMASSAALAQYGVVLGGGAGAAPATLSPSSTRNAVLRGGGSGANPIWGPGQVINYLAPNYDAEFNDTTGWATFADAASATPTDGTGGSPNSTWAATSTTPLRGTYSFLWTKSSGASRQGEGVSYDFTIDTADKGQVLQVSFDYIVSSGTFADNDMNVWVYDVTNTTMIQLAPTNILNTSASSKWNGVFQASSSSTSYRLILYVPVTTDSANTLRFDNFYVGPQRAAIGQITTDWKSYTPTGSWVSNTTYSGYWRRVGDSIHVIARVLLSGAPTAATLTIGLPSGVTIDTTKLPSTSTNSGAFGAARIYDSGTGQYTGTVLYQNTTTVTVSFTGSGSLGWVTNSAPMTFANGDEVDAEFIVPVLGWSSGQVLSNDADTRVVAARITGSSTCTGTVATTFAGSSAITWDAAAAIDTHGGYNGTTTYTVPSPGIYQISARVIQTGTEAANDTVQLALAINGVQSITGYDRIQASGLTAFSTTVFGNVSLVAGDALTMRLISATGTPALAASTNNVFWSINKLSGPAQIAASELVACRYTNTAGTTLTKSAANTVPFATKDYDSHGSFVTDTFTCPVAGKYAVKSHLLIATGATWANGDYVEIEVLKNGSRNGGAQVYINAAITGPIGAQISDTVNCVAGDTIKINCYPSKAAVGNVTLNTTAGYSYVAIERIGL